ncbi:TetR family transcriptional regulator [Clostridium sp. BSD9I1]|nr:TetR family transcriptional regulator [Clostridium sp. BSD9I1]
MSVEFKETAINLFSKNGYSGTSVRDITRSLGITFFKCVYGSLGRNNKRG